MSVLIDGSAGRDFWFNLFRANDFLVSFILSVFWHRFCFLRRPCYAPVVVYAPPTHTPWPDLSEIVG